MVRRTWNWILGIACIVLVALIWIAASFVVQSVVDSGVSPFLIAYICNSLFVVYIPVVELAWWLKRRLKDRAKGDSGISSADGMSSGEGIYRSNLTNYEKAQLLNQTSSSPNSSGQCIAAGVDLDEDDEEDSIEVLKGEEEGSSTQNVGGDETRLWTRKETAMLSLIICPVWFLAQLTFNLSLKYTSVTSNTVLSSTSTLFTFLVSLAFLGERFTILKLIGVVLCMTGTVLVGFGDTEAAIANKAAPHPVLGDIFCLVSAMFYAAYTTLIRKKFPDETKSKEEVSMALFLGYLGLFNAVIFLPIVLILHFTGLEPIHRLSGRQIGLIVGKGLFDNALSDYLWAWAVLLTTTTVATAGLTLQVPIAAVVDSLRGHSPDTLNVLGAIAVLVGFFGLNQPAEWFQSASAPREDEQKQSSVYESEPLAAP